MNNYILSLVRTYVPIGVGLALTWLARELGIVLDGDTSAMASAVAVALASGAWYALARALEAYWPTFGVLLGSAKAPEYKALTPRR
ncbi:hypothetical protein [Actinomadura sp. KC216]|uniref:hypothetical protein n=1 Tax=Actinomadura sp. KC216 TaxID=2530370 RepID=UPI001A9F137C|nr:hypothetical protein [Actinomadura sp. KC216]